MSQLLDLVWVMYFLAVRAYRTCILTQRPRNWKRWRNWCRWMIRVSKTSSSPLRRGRGFAQCSELRTNHQWKWKHDSECCPPRISKKKHRKPWLWMFLDFFRIAKLIDILQGCPSSNQTCLARKFTIDDFCYKPPLKENVPLRCLMKPNGNRGEIEGEYWCPIDIPIHIPLYPI